MDPAEINDPGAACLREIEEETGLRREQITGFALKYVVIINKSDLVDVIFYFIGETDDKLELIETDEGSLHWVGITDAHELPMSDWVKSAFRRWAGDPGNKRLMLCSVDLVRNINWIAL